RQTVTWEYSDPGALPFSGGHSVVADKTGLYIRDMHSETIQPEKGYGISAFAPWVFLKYKWQVKGDFSLPPLRDRRGYEAMKSSSEKARLSGVVHR
ncbi:MAG: cytochrome c family, partial [Geobacteraceae bacterium]